MARPEHEYSELIAAKIHALMTFGIPKEKISSYVHLSVKTICKHYGEIMEDAHENRNGAVEFGLFYNATVKNNVVAQMFYLKTQMPEKYSEKSTTKDISQDDLVTAVSARLPD